MFAYHISDAGIELIKKFEGLRLQSYRCPAGKWTIGYGTTEDEHGKPIQPGMVISEPEAEALLCKDLTAFERRVNRLITREISQHQFDALMSFAYNLGTGALERSALLKNVNAGRFDQAANEFPKWKFSNGQVLQGLVRRRDAERSMFLGLEA